MYLHICPLHSVCYCPPPPPPPPPPTFGPCMGNAQWHMHNTVYCHHMMLCYVDSKTPLKISAYAPANAYTYMRDHTFMYTCKHTCTYTCTHTTHTHTHTRTHTHTHTYTHINMDTCIQVHVDAQKLLLIYV